MPAPKISLIISTYQRPDALKKVLQGVAVQSLQPAEVLIADDGSGAPTRDLLTQWQKKLPTPLHHHWQPDDGFRKTAILNKSLATATGEYIVLLDGDCVPHRKFIADHTALAEKNFWVQGRRCFVAEKFVSEFSITSTSIIRAIVAGRITGAPKALRFPFPFIRRNTGQRGIIGCNMGIWRDDLLAINGFDENYAGWGMEDSDLGTRLYHLGRPRKFIYGRAIVFHLNHPAQSRAQLQTALDRLAETIRTRKTRCNHGLDQYLSSSAHLA